MPSQVKCLYCGKPFYKETTDYVSPQYRRYAHKTCEQIANNIHNLAKEVLGEYYSSQRINANIKEFVNNGMSLQEIFDIASYGYKIKNLSPEKSNGGFGIVPYLIPEYQQYQIKQNMLKRLNRGKKITDFVNKDGAEVTFEIPPIKQPRGLSFFKLG